MLKLFFLISVCSCVTVNNSDVPADASADAKVIKDCGTVPPAPYWEYTEEAGAPAQAKIPLHLWLQDLEWRDNMRLWVECEHPGTWVQLTAQ